jgi:DNA invertase Pin-like site-specific DNA recombinase
MVNALDIRGSIPPTSNETTRRAAQYVRMSTDHQRYSTANQGQVIAAYAAERNIEIVRTYTDDGRSGLTIVGRGGLQGLIADVQFARTDFDCILVYDISRWGRFQDVDESAYYEFICTRAGIKVHYCADEFENDGSLASTMLKVAKRFAAADFSRGLSKRVFIGQCRITELGFWHGGTPAIGLRRELVNEQGLSRGLLERGQRKALQTDRIVLRPGPASERKIVRQIFNLLVNESKGFKQIAAELNASELKTPQGNPWAGQSIEKILTNEAYIGTIVFNRRSYKLKKEPVRNPPEMWIRRNNALAPIIPPKIFAKAQQIIAERRKQLTDSEVLERLASLQARKGHLSNKLIAEAEDVPTSTALTRRFGSLTAAYNRIGFRAAERYHWAETEARMRTLIETAIAEIVTQLVRNGIQATFESQEKRLLLNSNGVTVTIGAARCLCEGSAGKRWRVKTDRNATTVATLIFRMNETNTGLQDYYLLLTSEIARTRVKRFRMTTRLFSKARLETIDQVVKALEALNNRSEQ